MVVFMGILRRCLQATALWSWCSIGENVDYHKCRHVFVDRYTTGEGMATRKKGEIVAPS